MCQQTEGEEEKGLYLAPNQWKQTHWHTQDLRGLTSNLDGGWMGPGPNGKHKPSMYPSRGTNSALGAQVNCLGKELPFGSSMLL